MNIRVFKNDLLIGTQTVQNVISTQITLPILSNILIEAEKDKINLTTTDLDIGVSYTLTAKVGKSGAITVPAKRFSDIIRELPEENVEIVARKNNSVEIKSGQSYFRLTGIPKDEFPKLPSFENKEFIELPQATFKRMMEMSVFAISKDETRYILNGTLVEIREDTIRLVATDGRRLVLIDEKQKFPQKIEKKVIIPSKTIHELIRNLSPEGEVKIIFGDNQVCFEFNQTIITSRLIEGDFPNYEQVIPKPSKDKITINKEQFFKAIKRVALFTNPDSQAIKIDVLKNKMILSKSIPELGEAKDEMPVKYNGNELSIGFNPNYLIDVLKVLNEDQIQLELSDPQKPGVIRVNGKYVYIVLPMQLT